MLFSVTFLWKGFTGLSITVGAILTLFVMMQVTGRARWNEALSPRGPSPERERVTRDGGLTTNGFVDGAPGADQQR